MVTSGHFKTVSPGQKLCIDSKGVTWVDFNTKRVFYRPYASASKRSAASPSNAGTPKKNPVPLGGSARKARRYSTEDHSQHFYDYNSEEEDDVVPIDHFHHKDELHHRTRPYYNMDGDDDVDDQDLLIHVKRLSTSRRGDYQDQ